MKFDAELLYKECCKENPDVELIKDIIQNLHKIYGKSDYMSEADLFRSLLFFSVPDLQDEYEYSVTASVMYSI